MVDNKETQNEKKSGQKMKKSNLIAVGIIFFIIFAILGFLIITKDSRKDEAETADESQLEKKVDVVDTDKEDGEDEGLMEEDGTGDLMEEEEEEVIESEETYYSDLYIHEYTITEDPMQNEEITVHIEIVNQGDADAGSFRWEWWANEDDVECDGEIGWLDVGEKETVECEFTYEDYGTYDTKVVADSEFEVDESDEDNNVMEEELEVAEEEYVDLTIGEYSFDPIPEKGVPFDVRIGIKNEGNVVAEDFYWEWWATPHSYACREHISEIAPNSTKVVTCDDYTYGGWSTYDTSARVDVDDDIEESDEDNNEYHEDVVPIH